MSRPEQTRRYTIEMTDVAAGKAVIFTAVDLTDEEKRVVVAQIAKVNPRR
jgi:hypothetical protein